MSYAGPEPFEDWFVENAIFWADPFDEDYIWPMRKDAPIDMVIAYLEYVLDRLKKREDLTVVD